MGGLTGGGGDRPVVGRRTAAWAVLMAVVVGGGGDAWGFLQVRLVCVFRMLWSRLKCERSTPNI